MTLSFGGTLLALTVYLLEGGLLFLSKEKVTKFNILAYVSVGASREESGFASLRAVWGGGVQTSDTAVCPSKFSGLKGWCVGRNADTETHTCTDTKWGHGDVSQSCDHYQVESSENRGLKMSLVPQRKKKHVISMPLLLIFKKERKNTLSYSTVRKSSTSQQTIFTKHIQPGKKLLENKNTMGFTGNTVVSHYNVAIMEHRC